MLVVTRVAEETRGSILYELEFPESLWLHVQEYPIAAVQLGGKVHIIEAGSSSARVGQEFLASNRWWDILII